MIPCPNPKCQRPMVAQWDPPDPKLPPGSIPAKVTGVAACTVCYSGVYVEVTVTRLPTRPENEYAPNVGDKNGQQHNTVKTIDT